MTTGAASSTRIGTLLLVPQHGNNERQDDPRRAELRDRPGRERVVTAGEPDRNRRKTRKRDGVATDFDASATIATIPSQTSAIA